MSVSLDSPPTLAGKKRKRYVTVEEDTSSVKLNGKLHHYLREMRKAAKKSRTFEIQRLVRKLKYLRRSAQASETAVSKDLEDLEAQLTSLKRTDYERIAYLALSSKMRKDGKLGSHQPLMASLAFAMSNMTTPNTTEKHEKAESRLLSSKILAAEGHEAVKGLRAILEPSMTTKLHGDVQTLDLNDDQGRVEGEANEDGEKRGPGILEDQVDNPIDDHGWESGSINSVETAINGDDNDEEGEKGNEKEREEEEGKEGSSSPHQNLLPSSILGPFNPSKSAASSTFLPSLSMGYIKGDTDSDVSDGENAANRRKNRRGQRARQAIWEKKYGKNARHVKKQREDAQSIATARALGKRPDQGWQGRGARGPITSIDRPANTTRRARTHSRGQLEGHFLSERTVHPSWEAKRKLKEKESARILPAQGKKIIFN